MVKDHATELFEARASQSLSEDVSGVLLGGNEFRLHLGLLNELTDLEVTPLDVLGLEFEM